MARALRRRINCGWWAQTGGTPLVVAALVLMAAMLWARRYWPEAAQWSGAVVAGVVAAVLGASWWVARRRFVNDTGALVRLESRLGLHNRLSAAAAGVCAWPAVPAQADPRIRWVPGQTLGPVLAAAGLLGAAWWVPVTAADQPHPRGEPGAWRVTEAELAQLERQQTVDPASLAQTRGKLEELRAQEPEKWFSHASLEATDKLREAHLRSAAELQANLKQTAQGAARLAAVEGGLTAQAQARAQDQFKQAVEAMKAGAMKPDPRLLEQLRQVDPGQLGQMDPQQLQEMIEQLRKAAEELGECCGDPGGDGDGGKDEGDGEGEGDGDGEEGPGSGAPARGPGTSDKLFGKERHRADAEQPQVLESRDLSKALPGEVLGTSEVERELDRRSPGLRSGGAADGRGGGSATWRESLPPKEQQALKRFFE